MKRTAALQSDVSQKCVFTVHCSVLVRIVEKHFLPRRYKHDKHRVFRDAQGSNVQVFQSNVLAEIAARTVLANNDFVCKSFSVTHQIAIPHQKPNATASMQQQLAKDFL